MTIKDIAQHFNTSVSVISRALNDRGYVNEQKRQAIKSYAALHHYQPSGTAKQLKQGAKNTIGIVMPWVLRNQMDFVQLLLNTMHRSRKEWQLMLGNNAQTVNQMAALQVPKIIAINITDEQLPAFQRAAARGVDILNIMGYCPGFSGVRVAHEKATYDCIKLLSANGHRRIAYIGLDLTQDTGALHRYYLQMVRKGMELAASEEALSFSEAENMLYCGEYYSFDHQQIRRLLLDYRPTAVLAWTEQAEAAIYAECREMQLNIPEDISIVGLGGNFMLDGFAPPLTHYRFDYTSVLKKIEAFIHAPPGEYNENHNVDFLFYPGNSIKNINL